jgi:hypothetical protein
MVTESFPVPDQSIAVTIETDGADPCTGPVGLTANVWGGTGSYLYNWSTGETTPSISTSGVSVVQVTVTDNGVCSTYATQYVPTVGGDLEYVVGGWLNRGFCRYLFPLVVNNSCATYTGAVTIEFDASVNVDAITPTPDAVVGNVAVWNSVTILSGEQFAVQAVVCVTLASACNDFVDVTITSDLGSDVLTPQILCSYDPNDKQVSPLGVGAEGFIENTEKLQYMVRFQNTGSVAATFIHVLDVLDADLDILSLNVVAASHAMELSISGDRTLDFFFDNINLPDSTSDLAGSSGFVIYEIDMLPGLSSGTEIENTASIYFDFNSPVITNTTLNTIAFPVGIQDVAAGNDAFTMYPNPTTGNVTIVRNGTAIYGLQVYDALGQLLHSVQGNKGTATVDISALPIGMYLLTLEDATGRYQSRLVKD